MSQGRPPSNPPSGRPKGFTEGFTEGLARASSEGCPGRRRARGPGWQTRMDAALRDWLQSHPETAEER